MNEEQMLARIKAINEELNSLPYISTVDDDGETDEDAYQLKIEQGWYRDDLINEKQKLLSLLKYDEEPDFDWLAEVSSGR